MAGPSTQYDLLIIGGGINGAGIARDAAGRGLRVLLVEKDDLAAATSAARSKLIHGGLRYLEQYEFRLVAEALAEREVLLKIAPHLVTPLTFVMPHAPGLRSRWMIRIGLFLHDHLGRRNRLPGSHGVDLRVPPYNSGLKPDLTHGFVYSDCRVDDARLVLANALSAHELGAEIATRTECKQARRGAAGWEAVLRPRHGAERTVLARGIVNAERLSRRPRIHPPKRSLPCLSHASFPPPLRKGRYRFDHRNSCQITFEILAKDRHRGSVVPAIGTLVPLLLWRIARRAPGRLSLERRQRSQRWIETACGSSGRHQFRYVDIAISIAYICSGRRTIYFRQKRGSISC